MKCKIVTEKLIFYLDNEIEEEEREQIKEHLAECNKCNELFNELTSVLEYTKLKEIPEVNPFLYTRIKQKLENYKDDKAEILLSFIHRLQLQPIILSFLLIFGLAGGIKLGNLYDANSSNDNTISQTTEYYLNDLAQEKLEAFLLENQ